MRRYALFLIVLTGQGQEQLKAQERIIPDDVACRECSIRLDTVATLRPPPEILSIPVLPRPAVARSRSGRYLVGPTQGDAVLAIFSPSGEFLHDLGRQGGGPDEYSGIPYPMNMQAVGSRVLVVQGRYMHLVDLDSPETVSRVGTRLVPSDVAAANGGAVVYQSAVMEAPGGGGTLLQVVSADGQVVRGFGHTDAASDTRSHFATTRVVAPATDPHHVWSARPNSYQIRQYDYRTGNPVLDILRRAEWFPEYGDYLPGEVFAKPQRPKVEDIFDAGSDTLWVAISHGDAEFRPVVETKEGTEGRIDLALVDFNRLLDTTIEVLDTASGRVVARQTVDAYLHFVATPSGSPPLLYELRADDWGELSCVVYTAKVSRPER